MILHRIPARIDPACVRALAEPGTSGLESVTLDQDWNGEPVPVSARVLLLLDDAYLHLAVSVVAPGPARTLDDPVPGRFRAGLWQGDVVELFLCDVDGAGYREYHLSPAGEWWMGCFSAPRVEMPVEMPAEMPVKMPAGMPAGMTVEVPAETPLGSDDMICPDGSGGPPARTGELAPGVEPQVAVWTSRCRNGWRGTLSLPEALLPPGVRGALAGPGRALAGVGEALVPPRLRGNLTAILGEPRTFLSLVPLPGERPDFHQPGHFPLAVEKAAPARYWKARLGVARPGAGDPRTGRSFTAPG